MKYANTLLAIVAPLFALIAFLTAFGVVEKPSHEWMTFATLGFLWLAVATHHAVRAFIAWWR